MRIRVAWCQLKISIGLPITNAESEMLTDYEVHYTPHKWKAKRVHGGGEFAVPKMVRSKAIDFVLRNGAHQLCAVDDVYKIIFYRSV